MNNAQVTDATGEKIKTWLHAKHRLERAKRELTSAECELANSTSALGKFLCPDDAQPGEKFQIWFLDGLIEVTKAAQHDFSVGWRKPISPKSQADFGVSI